MYNMKWVDMTSTNIVLSLEDFKSHVMDEYSNAIGGPLFRELCELGFRAHCITQDTDYMNFNTNLSMTDVCYVVLGEYLEGECITVDLDYDIRNSSWYCVVMSGMLVFDDLLLSNDVVVNDNFLRAHVIGWLGDCIVLNGLKT